MHEIIQNLIAQSAEFTGQDLFNIAVAATWFPYLLYRLLRAMCCSDKRELEVLSKHNTQVVTELVETLKYTTDEALHTVKRVVASFNKDEN